MPVLVAATIMMNIGAIMIDEEQGRIRMKSAGQHPHSTCNTCTDEVAMNGYEQRNNM